MSDTVPTFATNRDRLTYLLGEYKVPLTVIVLAAGVWAVWASPQLPQPPDSWLAFSAAWGVLALPAYMVCRRIVSWLHTRDWVTVYHINSVEDTRKVYRVDPDVWAEKSVDGPAPYPVNGGSAWEVREFEYLDDVEELRVKGTWMSATLDSNLVTSKAMMEDVHGFLVDGYMELSRLRARISRMGLEIQHALINEEAEARERGIMLDRDATRQAFEDAREDTKGDDEIELPEIEDYRKESLVEPFKPDPLSEQAATDGGVEK